MVNYLTFNYDNGCCGIYHLSGFNSDEFASSDLKNNLKEGGDYSRHKKLFTITLTSYQMEDLPKTLKVMKEIGFERVSVFRNNGGNVCNTFHLLNNKCGDNLTGFYPDY